MSGLMREGIRLVYITFADPILGGVDRWAGAVERYLISYLTNGAAGTVPQGEVHITQGADW